MQPVTKPAIDFKYHQGPYAPDWFDTADPCHYDITRGTSPFNEWWGFNNDDDLHKLAHSFSSQTFIDGFVYVEDEKAWYHYEDVNEHFNDDECSVYYTAKDGAWIADERAMLEAESRF